MNVAHFNNGQTKDVASPVINAMNKNPFTENTSSGNHKASNVKDATHGVIDSSKQQVGSLGGSGSSSCSSGKETAKNHADEAKNKIVMAEGGIDNATKFGYDKTVNVATSADGKIKTITPSADSALTDNTDPVNQTAANVTNNILDAVDLVKVNDDNTKKTSGKNDSKEEDKVKISRVQL